MESPAVVGGLEKPWWACEHACPDSIGHGGRAQDHEAALGEKDASSGGDRRPEHLSDATRIIEHARALLHQQLAVVETHFPLVVSPGRPFKRIALILDSWARLDRCCRVPRVPDVVLVLRPGGRLRSARRLSTITRTNFRLSSRVQSSSVRDAIPTYSRSLATRAGLAYANKTSTRPVRRALSVFQACPTRHEVNSPPFANDWGARKRLGDVCGSCSEAHGKVSERGPPRALLALVRLRRPG